MSGRLDARLYGTGPLPYLTPFMVGRGRPAWIAIYSRPFTDAEGREYIDGMASLWNVNVGYGRTELAEAAAAQMKTLAFSSAYVTCCSAQKTATASGVACACASNCLWTTGAEGRATRFP